MFRTHFWEYNLIYSAFAVPMIVFYFQRKRIKYLYEIRTYSVYFLKLTPPTLPFQYSEFLPARKGRNQWYNHREGGRAVGRPITAVRINVFIVYF